MVQFKGLRIGGLSGIYKQHDYSLGHFERAPYSEATKRSVYHLRSLEVLRLGQVARRLDVVLSHDWPRGVYRFGDVSCLLSNKPFFRPEVEANVLGSPPAEQLLCRLRPRYWFSAHLHCKFSAIVQHSVSLLPLLLSGMQTSPKDGKQCPSNASAQPGSAITMY